MDYKEEVETFINDHKETIEIYEKFAGVPWIPKIKL